MVQKCVQAPARRFRTRFECNSGPRTKIAGSRFVSFFVVRDMEHVMGGFAFLQTLVLLYAFGTEPVDGACHISFALLIANLMMCESVVCLWFERYGSFAFSFLYFVIGIGLVLFISRDLFSTLDNVCLGLLLLGPNTTQCAYLSFFVVFAICAPLKRIRLPWDRLYSALDLETEFDMNVLNNLAQELDNPVECTNCLYGPLDLRGCFTIHKTKGNECPRCQGREFQEWNQDKTTEFSDWEFVLQAYIRLKIVHCQNLIYISGLHLLWYILKDLAIVFSKILHDEPPSVTKFIGQIALDSWFTSVLELLNYRDNQIVFFHSALVAALVVDYLLDPNSESYRLKRRNRKHEHLPRQVPLPRPVLPVLLGRTKFSAKKKVQLLKDSCSICLENFTFYELQRKRVTALLCEHYFHVSCVSGQSRCPLCRRP